MSAVYERTHFACTVFSTACCHSETGTAICQKFDDLVLPCPGEFRSDLRLFNCEYSEHKRVEQWVTTGFTDQAMLQSLLSAGISTAIKSPGEWPRTTRYYWQRTGAAYTGAMARATAEYLVGLSLHDDPRHITCDQDDTRLFRQWKTGEGFYECSLTQRILHVMYDSVMFRESRRGPLYERVNQEYQAVGDEGVKRLPAFSRLAGVFASALAQIPWNPPSQNTPGAIAQRAGLSFLLTFAGSFYTEFGIPIPPFRGRRLHEVR